MRQDAGLVAGMGRKILRPYKEEETGLRGRIGGERVVLTLQLRELLGYLCRVMRIGVPDHVVRVSDLA